MEKTNLIYAIKYVPKNRQVLLNCRFFGEMLYKNPINIGRIGCPPDNRFGIPSIPDGLGGNDSLE